MRIISAIKRYFAWLRARCTYCHGAGELRPMNTDPYWFDCPVCKGSGLKP